MANKSIFAPAPKGQAADTTNRAGGAAYAMGWKHALAQLAATGTFSDSAYATAEDHLTALKGVLDQADDLDFVAKVALYSRESGNMKDMPAFLVVWLAAKHYAGLESVFNRVVDNGKMLRNVVQILRSGVTGKKSANGRLRRLLRNWFRQDVDTIMRQSVGGNPSMRDVLRIVKPKPRTIAHNTLFAWLADKSVQLDQASELLRDYLTFRDAVMEGRGDDLNPPNVPFQLLDSLPLTKGHWKTIFERGGWQFVRMNLNTAARKGLLPELSETIAAKLRDPEAIRKARVMPYQLLAAYKNFEGNDRTIRDALHDALELSLANVPTLDGSVAVFVDSSGSMGSPITGHRPGQTSKMSCADVAGIFAAAIVRKNTKAIVVSFDTQAEIEEIEPRDSCMTIARQLSKNGGGTDCAKPFELLDEMRIYPDFCITISDSESWAGGYAARGQSRAEAGFQRLKRHNPKAKDVRIDIKATTSEQRPAGSDTLLVGGFSDAVFDAIARFQKGVSQDSWLAQIEAVKLDATVTPTSDEGGIAT